MEIEVLGEVWPLPSPTSHTGASDWPSTNYTDIVYQGIPASAVFSFSMVEVQRGAWKHCFLNFWTHPTVKSIWLTCMRSHSCLFEIKDLEDNVMPPDGFYSSLCRANLFYSRPLHSIRKCWPWPTTLILWLMDGNGQFEKDAALQEGKNGCWVPFHSIHHTMLFLPRPLN